MGELQRLPNIGKELERQLYEVGITSPEELRRIGSRDAWLRIFAQDPSAGLAKLLALQGAIAGVNRNDLSETTKTNLQTFCSQYKPKRR
ncbi:MAG: TfoX/Sxy family protein [Clostridia bacterium]|nr:TfoX/Sxy family protein [Clostridia bacterium]